MSNIFDMFEENLHIFGVQIEFWQKLLKFIHKKDDFHLKITSANLSIKYLLPLPTNFCQDNKEHLKLQTGYISIRDGVNPTLFFSKPNYFYSDRVLHRTTLCTKKH